MQLLARGLQLWVRQQCQSIDSLEIRLEGSPLQLLRGRLAGVRLLARRVVYQQFHLVLVELAKTGAPSSMVYLRRREGALHLINIVLSNRLYYFLY